jgi:hypothetical protein
MSFPILKVDTGRLRTDGDPPYVCVSIIAHPAYFYLAGALAFVLAMAALS